MSRRIRFLMRQRALVLLAALLVVAPTVAQAQRADGLDQPLLEANMCGAGDSSETHFTLAATGDTFPHENIQAVGETQGYDVLFDAVRPFLQAADLAYTNFDGAMLEGAGYSGYPNFNFNPALASALKNAGIGLVSTANNHILDRGPEGLDATLRVLETAGIQQHGAVASNTSERPPYLPITLTRDGVSVTIGFVSATWGTNGIPDPNNQVNLLYESNAYGQQGGVRQSVLDAIAQAEHETDFVLVAAHWGTEYQFYPDPSQVEAAQRMAEAGADAILGAQSHTLQPVDLLDTGGRKTLVIYSLANFLASQGAYQAQFYSATSAIFYLGLARNADGQVRVTGYRYLPTIHVDNDTRPAPLQPGSADDVLSHVRTIMRDPAGTRQLGVEPPTALVTVCPALTLGEAPDTPIPGDFAQHYATLAGTTARPLTDAIAVLGLPLGPVVNEPAGDCGTNVPVLYTERQRLELHAEQPWPYRVSGSQLGAHAFAQRYPGTPTERRTDLAAADAFADSRFRTFYEQNGGLDVFGYPISGALNEDNPETGAPTSVQYFERARFELAPNVAPGASLSDQVRLGLLGRALRDAGGAAALCAGFSAPLAASTEPIATTELDNAALAAAQADNQPSIVGALAQVAGGNWWLPALVAIGLLVAIVALVGFAVADWRSYRRRGGTRGYRRRRSAYERFGGSRTATEPPARAQSQTVDADAAWAAAAAPAVRRVYEAEPARTGPSELVDEEWQTPPGASWQPHEPNGQLAAPDDEPAGASWSDPEQKARPASTDDADQLLRRLLGE